MQVIRGSIGCLMDEFLQERAVEVAADSVIDEALLVLRLVSRLVAEHHVVIPPPLDLQQNTQHECMYDALSNSNKIASSYFSRVLLYVCERIALYGRVLAGPLLQLPVLPLSFRLSLFPLSTDTLQLRLQLLLVVVLVIGGVLFTGK